MEKELGPKSRQGQERSTGQDPDLGLLEKGVAGQTGRFLSIAQIWHAANHVLPTLCVGGSVGKKIPRFSSACLSKLWAFQLRAVCEFEGNLFCFEIPPDEEVLASKARWKRKKKLD